MAEIKEMDAIVFAVPHDAFVRLAETDIRKYFNGKKKKILIDIKGIFDQKEFEKSGYEYWRL